MSIRPPAVAGTFYPADKDELAAFLRPRLEPESGSLRRRAVAALLPHAGYVYSGPTACAVVRELEVPPQLLILGPNHTGQGHPFSVFAAGSWQTPLGSVAVDHALASRLLKASSLLADDHAAHEREHSIEVELPILQAVRPRLTFVPIVVGSGRYDLLRRMAGECLEVLKDISPHLLLIASSDMTHYESYESVSRKDRYAIDALSNLDEEALARACEKHDISMCGLWPAFCMLIMAKGLGARRGRLVRYATSAEASGDTSRVVGYAGMVFEA